MLISIVTPSYNQARYIEETIRSVLSQDAPQIEYLIMDGGSTDGTIDIIKKYAKPMESGSLRPSFQQQAARQRVIDYWVSEKDRGQTDAINKGFARAQGEVFAWLNSDDTYEPGAVTAAARYLQEHPNVGMVYGDCNYINASGGMIGKFEAAQTNYRLLRRGYTRIPQQTMFFRAGLWKQLGPLDPSFYFAMDYDLWTRIAAHTEIKYVPQTWANFRLHTSGKSILADERCWPEMLRVHYRDGGSFFSVLVAKYYLRKFVSPIWNWRRRKMLNTESKVFAQHPRGTRLWNSNDRSRWTPS